MKKRIFTLFFAVLFLLTATVCTVPGAAAESQWKKSITPLPDAESLLTVNGNAMSGSLTVADVPADPADSLLWKVEKKAKGYVFQSVSSEQYLTLTKDGAALGNKAQTISVSPGIYGSYLSSGNYFLKFADGKWGVTTEKDTASEVTFMVESIPEYDNTGKELLYRVACFSDLHVDYGIHLWDPPIRESTVNAVEVLKKLGGADAMIVGGDIVSSNNKAGWTKAQFDAVKATVYSTLAPGTSTGAVMPITGNHDNEPGINAGGTYYSGEYDDMMLDNIGEFDAAFYSTELKNPLESTRFNELLCYRYTLDNMVFIGINTPFRPVRGDSYIYAEQISWVSEQMKEVGRDKTVILFSHYPTINSPGGDKGGDSASKLKSLLGLYPNIIYCYGHAHDEDDMTIYNTCENVVPNGDAKLLDNGAYQVSSAITCFMGSMGYYDYDLPSGPSIGGLTSADPAVVQFLLIDFYADHITFKYYNTGEYSPDADVYEISSFTVMRDMAQLTGGASGGDSSDPNSDDAGNTDKTPSDSTGTAGVGGSEAPASPVIWIVLAVCVVVIAACAVFVVLYLKKNKKEK